MTDPIPYLARQAEQDDHFLGALLAGYARSEQMDDHALAAFLGCPPGELPFVKLCRAPRPDRAAWRRDIQAVVQRFGLVEEALIEAVRRGEVLRRLRASAGRAGGTLLAAREDDTPPSEPEGEP